MTEPSDLTTEELASWLDRTSRDLEREGAIGASLVARDCAARLRELREVAEELLAAGNSSYELFDVRAKARRALGREGTG